MAFPGTWMTESESMAYRVVPKCACSTIGQIMFFSDHARYFDGDIHDSTSGLHKWNQDASQPAIEQAVKARKPVSFTCVRNPYARILSSFFDKIAGIQRNGRRYRGNLVPQLAQRYGIDVGSPDNGFEFDQIASFRRFLLFARDTIAHNVTLALLGLSKERWNPLSVISRNTELIERAHDALQRVGLRHIADRPLSQTSYGERRRVEIAMALAQNPKVLLLDEPYAGLSIDERRDVHETLRAIPRDVTIVMIEHNMDVALDFAERITLLHFGKVIVEGSRAEVVADPRTREVYLGH